MNFSNDDKIKHKISKDSLIYHIQSEGLTDRQILKFIICHQTRFTGQEISTIFLIFANGVYPSLPTHWYCQGYKKVLH